MLVVVLTALCLACPIAWAETGFLVVQVKDVERRPIAGLEIGVEGDSGSAVTDLRGKARIRLAASIKEGSTVSLRILKSPPGQDLVMVSPWDSRILIPSFENGPDNFVEVVVVQRASRAVLDSGTVLAAVSRIIRANTPSSADKQAAQGNPKANLEVVARQFGLSPEDLDKAIKAWGAKATDPYETGLAALYERNYSKATADLQDSLKQRKEKLVAGQNAVADAAFFLGFSLYEQDRYQDSAVAYQDCLQIRQDDATVLNNTAVSLQKAGDYAAAESLFRRALAIREKTLGSGDPEVATSLNNLAELLQDKGDYAAAEPFYRRALAIDANALGPDSPDVARDLNSLAGLLYVKGDYAAAEPLYRRTLAIDVKVLGPYHPLTAQTLNNLAAMLEAKGDYAGAEPLFRRALMIDRKTLGPDHPSVATDLSNLAALLYRKGSYAEAEPLMREALAMQESTVGPDNPQVATSLNNLALLLREKHDYAGAEPLLRQALAIRVKSVGPDHPDVANSLNNLAMLLYTKGDYAGAEPLLRRALAIDEKALGPDHPNTRQVKQNLDNFLQKSAQAAAPKAKN